MPSLTIHIAIGKEYIRKHKEEIKNETEFIKGTIAPDLNESMTELNKNKNITHYGKWGNYQVKTDIELFLNDEKVDISKDYWKGYLLHLLVDYYFYNKYFKKEYEDIIKNNDKFYYDFDCLNYILIPKYRIDVINSLKKYMAIDKNRTKTKYLKEDKIINFIEKMSNIDFEKEIETIKEIGTEGLE